MSDNDNSNDQSQNNNQVREQETQRRVNLFDDSDDEESKQENQNNENQPNVIENKKKRKKQTQTFRFLPSHLQQPKGLQLLYEKLDQLKLRYPDDPKYTESLLERIRLVHQEKMTWDDFNPSIPEQQPPTDAQVPVPGEINQSIQQNTVIPQEIREVFLTHGVKKETHQNPKQEFNKERIFQKIEEEEEYEVMDDQDIDPDLDVQLSVSNNDDINANYDPFMDIGNEVEEDTDKKIKLPFSYIQK